MLNFLQENNIKNVRENNLKLLFGLGSCVYAAFGILLHTSDVAYNDPLWLRMIILTVGIISLTISVYIPEAKKHFIKILFGNLYIYNAHLYFLLYINDFDPNYKLSLLVITFASILFIQDRKLNRLYLIINTITHVAVMLISNSVNFENIGVGLLILMVLCIGYFTNRERIDAFTQIKDRETILKSINNNVYHGIFRIDGEDNILYANENFATMLGYASLEEIRNLRKPLKYVSQDLGRQINVSKMKGESIKNIEAEILCRDGKTMWALLSLTPFKDEISGEIIFFDGAIIDISDRKRAEKDMMLFTAAIDHSPACVAITNTSGHIRYINPFFSAATGFTVDELIGNRIQDYLLKDDEGTKEMRAHLKKGLVWKGELKHESKSGKIRTQLASIAPIKNSSGHIINFVIVAEDITARKEAEKELLWAKEQAENANRAQEKFLSTISHELRTPMNAVIGITNLLFEEEPREDQVENLKILKFSANNLLALINDLLDLSKIEAGKLDMVAKDFDLHHTLNVIRKSHSLITNQKGVELAVNIESNVPKVLIGDVHRLNQILNNLVGNAVKFTDKGKIQINVKAEKYGDNGVMNLLFEIKDTGIGIPADKINYIFEAFSQASALTNRIYGGTGLGLAITKRLIRLQGGEINVSSELNKGTTFTFNILYKKSERVSLPKIEEVKNYSGLSQIRILLVEDNKINQKVATKFLKKWEATVDVADNGEEALQKLNSNYYDVVLMDLLMPVLDGYSAIKKIRKSPKNKHLPIIALTASAMSHEREKAFEAGVDDYICKPFIPSELYNKIAKYAYSDLAKLKTA